MIIALGLRPMRTAAGGDARRALLLDLVLPIALFGFVSVGYLLPTPAGKWGEYALYA